MYIVGDNVLMPLVSRAVRIGTIEEVYWSTDGSSTSYVYLVRDRSNNSQYLHKETELELIKGRFISVGHVVYDTEHAIIDAITVSSSAFGTEGEYEHLAKRVAFLLNMYGTGYTQE